MNVIREEMNKKEAKELLSNELNKYRKLDYSELRRHIDADPYTSELKLENGNWYQFEIQVFWDDKPEGDIRVIGSVDDGGWRAFVPMSESFILAPSGKFVDE